MSDESASTTTDRTATSATGYSERLRVPWWWWPIAFALTGLLAAEIHLGAPGVRSWLPYLLLLPVPIMTLHWLGRLPVTVGSGADRELRVGRAHIPVRLIARAAAIPATAKSAALGRQLDPAAFVQHRPWVGPMVLLVIDDPTDPTPYWLVSTRHPDQLLAALGRPSR
ncbi:DUF3093 domain-containing protein [Skermania piniformis]|uniref:DUF3093 domain-containing protein n=1 Tax=Skermania pinensis TaxID=39122 RepID=A0ABX8SF26_9ACTN|nr:DUF3093 domain-containing protein [Skermania piniformis]QXQ15200.1 DUF3093 domain-containing protein [Skermania piniformis]